MLSRPVTFYYRNKTADEFLSELIGLKNELNGIGNTFNQAVHALHTLDDMSEIKAWAVINGAGQINLLKKVDEIRKKMGEIYDHWREYGLLGKHNKTSDQKRLKGG